MDSFRVQSGSNLIHAFSTYELSGEGFYRNINLTVFHLKFDDNNKYDEKKMKDGWTVQAKESLNAHSLRFHSLKSQPSRFPQQNKN